MHHLMMGSSSSSRSRAPRAANKNKGGAKWSRLFKEIIGRFDNGQQQQQLSMGPLTEKEIGQKLRLEMEKNAELEKLLKNAELEKLLLMHRVKIVDTNMPIQMQIDAIESAKDVRGLSSWQVSWPDRARKIRRHFAAKNGAEGEGDGWSCVVLKNYLAGDDGFGLALSGQLKKHILFAFNNDQWILLFQI